MLVNRIIITLFVTMDFILPLQSQNKTLYRDLQYGLSSMYKELEVTDTVMNMIVPAFFDFYVTPTKNQSDTLKYNSQSDTIICINLRHIELVGPYGAYLWSSLDTIERHLEFDIIKGCIDYSSVVHRSPTRDTNFYELLRNWKIEEFIEKYASECLDLDGDYANVSRVVVKNGRIVDVKFHRKPLKLKIPN